MKGAMRQQPINVWLPCIFYSAPNYPMVTRRFNKFERGRQSLEDDLQSGRPSNAVNAIAVAAVEKLIIANRTANWSEILKEF